MAVIFETNDPAKLLKAFNDRTSQTDPKGKITTWQRDADGDYTHKADDWKGKAWFTASTSSGKLKFHIIKRKDENITKVVYAYYHGHLIETFLAHFDAMFSEASSSALCTGQDVCFAA